MPDLYVAGFTYQLLKIAQRGAIRRVTCPLVGVDVDVKAVRSAALKRAGDGNAAGVRRSVRIPCAGTAAKGLDLTRPGAATPRLADSVSGPPELQQTLISRLPFSSQDGRSVAAISINLRPLAQVIPASGPLGTLRIWQAIADRLRTMVSDACVISHVGSENFNIAFKVGDVSTVAERTREVRMAFEPPLQLDDGTSLQMRVNSAMDITPGHDVSADSRSGLAVEVDHEPGASLLQADSEQTSQECGPPAIERLLFELHRAPALGQLSLAFQPKFDLRSWRYAGSEVLLRWNSPILGYVPPSEFIPIAEESGLIRPIGKWVLREAVRSIAALPDRVLEESRLAVNVSAAQLASETFVPWLARLLAEEGVPGSALELEVTESALMTSTKLAAIQLGELRALGISITLDDFGTGYSSLSHLRHLPVNTVKIAPDFIADIDHCADAGRLVAAIVNMAHALDLRVVAEGIETASQAVFLRDLGCDVGQGFLFARPMDYFSFHRWLQDPPKFGSVVS